MESLDNYLESLNEDFGFQMKAFKGKLLQKMAKGIKQNVKGKNVNIDAIKKILKPIPSMSQEKLNKFLDKYVPNYMLNYKIAERTFKNKYPTEQHIDNLAGTTALLASIDKDKTLQQQIKRTDRLYSSNLGSGGGPFIVFVIGLGIIIMGFSSVDITTVGTAALAALLGGLIMTSSILRVVRG